ncbi:MAG TPA: hypothetical protein VHQ22_10855 [Terriglobales bacterium]|jgi:hypothetical protein|nr:hypothetical protein [Terriglobales bacterium]
MEKVPAGWHILLRKDLPEGCNFAGVLYYLSQMSTNNQKNPLQAKDAEQLTQVFKDFHDLREIALQADEAAVNRIQQLNRDGAALYEKLAVLSTGILAFFLNFVISRSQNVHISKGTFRWLFCPAEGLLLVSIYLCGRSIIHFRQANILVTQNHSANWSTYTTQYLSVHTAKFGALLSGDLTRETGETVDAAEHFAQLSTSLKQAAAGIENSRKKQMAEYRDRNLQAQIAQLMTLIALLLLCIFMLKTLPI